MAAVPSTPGFTPAGAELLPKGTFLPVEPRGSLWPPQPPLQGTDRGPGEAAGGRRFAASAHMAQRAAGRLEGWGAAAPGGWKPPLAHPGMTRGLPRQLPDRGCGNPALLPGCCPDSSVRVHCGGARGGGGPHLLLPHHRDGHHLEDFGMVVLSVRVTQGGQEAAFEADKYHFLCKAVKSP